MTVRALGGLLVFNLFVLGVGAGLLWGIRGWRWWIDLVRLAGVAYLLGLASLMILLTFEMVVGIPLGVATVVVSGVVLAVVGILVGRARGHSLPALGQARRLPGLTLFAALFVAGIVVYLEALVRADRLAGIVREWDGWAFWMPRAESIYFFGRLEPEFVETLAQPSGYPPGLSTIQASTFHAMGSADTASVHVQYWFLAVAFVAAVAGLLARRVHHAILFPLLLLLLVAPSLLERVTTVYADVPLGYLIGVAALLFVLWLEDRKTWQLAAATILLAGAMLTKREGLLFAACVLLAALAASWSERGRLWPRLVGAGVVAFALTLPWRIWFTAHGLRSDAPDSGYLGAFDHLDRIWPSLELVVTTLFDRDLWRLVPFVAVAAIVLALAARAWNVAVFAGAFTALAIAGATWAIWANPTLTITQDDAGNPIVRITGTTILTLGILAPLLLQRAWSARKGDPNATSHGIRLGPDALIWRSRAAWAIVALGVLSHPGSMLVGYSGSGLPGGAPRYPGAADCVAAPASGRSVRVVVGYADSYLEADAIRGRALEAGLPVAEVEQDGCGRLRVFVDDVPTVDASQALVTDAQAAGLEPTLELDPND